MKNVIRLALVDPNDVSRNALKTVLLDIESVWLEAECSRYDAFDDVLKQTQPDIALVALDSNTVSALELVGLIHQKFPACSILALSNSQEGSLILQAVRQGAKEFLPSPLKLEDFLGALERIRHIVHKNTSDGTFRSSQIISVAGVSGGIGCTSLAINLGCCFAQMPEHSVAIIDLDLALGDADAFEGLNALARALYHLDVDPQRIAGAKFGNRPFGRQFLNQFLVELLDDIHRRGPLSYSIIPGPVSAPRTVT